MCSRRNKPILQGAVLLALVGGLAYAFYLYNLTIMDLETSRSEADKYLKQQESLSSQLQVVYEHRARLERSLQKEKTDHKNTKLDFSKKQNDFLLNVTRSKHEAMNRFNSLETQYNMLKAQAKELETEYSRIQQQYSRLSSEHSQVNNQQRRNFQLFKEQKANEIASLDDEIKALKQQVVSLRTHLKSKTEEAEQHKVSSSRAMAANKRYQEILKPLQEELANYRKLQNPFVQPRTIEASRNVKQDRVERTEARYQGDHVVDSNEKRVDEQENVGKPLEKESSTEPPRSDSRHHQDHSRHQRNVQIKAPSDNDLREPSDEDANKQEQHGNDESQIRDGIHPRSSDQDKARDNSQDDSYPRRGNVPLRDSNQDVMIADKEPVTQVTSPVKNNPINRWSDILKAAEESQYGKREEGGNKAVKEEWGENKREEMKTPDEDRKQLGEEEAADKQIGKPVAQPGPVADRLGLQGDQYINARGAQGDSERRNQQFEENDKGDKGEEEAVGLSREKMNKQMAELEESYQQKQIQQQEQLKAAQSQQQADRRRSMASDNKVVPIPAVQRQDKADEEHRTQADVDSDDEDADKPDNEKEDPDEEDPDDAGEEGDDNMEDQQQQQQVHQDLQRHQGKRKYDRSLKAAAATHDNSQQNRQESKRM